MISYFVRHPVAANLLMVLIAVLGVSVVSGIERETFPAFTADSVAVSVSYPGASARDVDEEICGPIESALTGVSGLEELSCLSVEGRAAATAELEENGELIQFFNDVSSAVSGISDFPADAEAPSIEVANRSDLVALAAISGIAGKDGLVSYADDLSDRLLALDGVAEATVSGITDRELKVSFDQQALRRFGLSSNDLVNVIEARSFQQPLGNASLSEGDLVLRYAGATRTVADLEDLIVIENPDGAVARLSDVATVTLVDSDENTQSFIDGSQTAIISISKSSDEDSIRLFERVNALLEAERAAYPAPFDITVISNFSELIEQRINLIVENIVLGLFLVFATMWLFFSLREALWISVALPVSFLGSLYVMSVLGITINLSLIHI